MSAPVITTLSSRDFNQHTGRAKKAAEKGPVFITDRGRPTHVVLSIEEYHRITGTGRSLVDMLAQTDPDSDFDFDPPRLDDMGFKPVDFD